MKRSYHVVGVDSKKAAKRMEAFCRANGQLVLPLVELIEQARLAVDTLLEEAGRGVIETILELSAAEVAGPKTPDKATGEIRWHDTQPRRVKLADRQLAVRLNRPGFPGD